MTYYLDLSLCALAAALLLWLGLRRPKGNRYKRNRLWRDAVIHDEPRPDERSSLKRHWDILDRKHLDS